MIVDRGQAASSITAVEPAAALSDARAWALDSAMLATMQPTHFRKHVLANGLTVLLQPHPATALVHVAVGYRVGSMEERPGQTGLAHFLEHMMFAGTRQLPGSYIERMIGLGATDVNAMTSRDITRYWQTVPANLLDFVLFAEADRMENFAVNLDPDTIERERGVIQEEKRQNAANPLGKLGEWIAEGLLEYGHPYHHPVIGYAEDIARHGIEDLRAWHAAHYGPGNAVIVVAGGIDPDAALDAVERRFGGIPARVSASRMLARASSTPLQTEMRAVDRISEPGNFFMAWNTPSVVASPRAHLALELAAHILGGGRSSLLHERLVDREELATYVMTWTMAGRASGAFGISVDLKEAADARVISAIRETLDLFLAVQVTPKQLEDARVSLLARRWRSSVDFEFRATSLIEGELLHGDAGWPGHEARMLAGIDAAELLTVARKWLSGGGLHLAVDQAQPLALDAPAVSPAPAICDPAAITINPPAWEERRLASGALLRLSQQPGGTAFGLRAIGGGGRAREPVGLEGMAELVASVPAIGAGPDAAATFSSRIDSAGLTIHLGTGLLSTKVDIGGPLAALPAGLAALSDVVLRPRYGSPDYVKRIEKLTEGARARDGTAHQRHDIALHGALVGKGHRLSAPKPAAAGLAEVLTVDAMQRFHIATWRPEETVLLLAADIAVDAAVALCDAMLDGWADGSASDGAVRTALEPVQPGLRLIDLSGSDTVQISLAWRPAAPADNVDILVLCCLQHVLAGGFVSRANRRLREELGWTYGVGGNVVEPVPGHAPVFGMVSVSLNPDRAGEALLELQSIVAALRTDRPPTQDEIETFRREERQRLARLNETAAHAIDALEIMIQRGYRHTEDWRAYRDRLESLDPATLQARAARLLPAPEDAIWMLMGDAGRIRASLDRTGLLNRVVEDDR